MLGKNVFILLLSSADFFKINFFKKIFQEHYQRVKRFGSGSGQHSVGPDLGQNDCKDCQQKTKVAANKERVKQ